MKRRDPESIIVEYFLSAEPFLASTMFRIVRGIVDQRGLPIKRTRPAAPTNGDTPRARTRKTRSTPLVDVTRAGTVDNVSD